MKLGACAASLTPGVGIRIVGRGPKLFRTKLSIFYISMWKIGEKKNNDKIPNNPPPVIIGPYLQEDKMGWFSSGRLLAV